MSLLSRCPRVGLVALGVALLAPGEALAVDCEDISGGAPIVYGAGGSAQRDLLGKISVQLQNSDDPLFLVYKDDGGACSGINALVGTADPTITGTAYYWDSATGGRATCDLPLAGAEVDFASMIVTPFACPLVTDESLLENIAFVEGPISAVTVVVPEASTQQAISAEAFYLVYGLGPAANIAPWNNADESYYIKRDENSAAAQILGLATGLDVVDFYGTDAGSNSNTITLLTQLADPEAGIGFCSADVADANRDKTNILAWKQFGQNVAYWPDSTAASFDKRNVRDGHYPLWMPGFLYALGDPDTGETEDENVQVLLDYFSGLSIPGGVTQTITDTAISNKNIPQCAMEVGREGDVGPLYALEPAEPCGCYYDFATTGESSCATCDDATPCSGTDVCRNGFCEAY